MKYGPGQFNLGWIKMFSFAISALLPSMAFLHEPAKKYYFPFVELDGAPQNLPATVSVSCAKKQIGLCDGQRARGQGACLPLPAEMLRSSLAPLVFPQGTGLRLGQRAEQGCHPWMRPSMALCSCRSPLVPSWGRGKTLIRRLGFPISKNIFVLSLSSSFSFMNMPLTATT